MPRNLGVDRNISEVLCDGIGQGISRSSCFFFLEVALPASLYLLLPYKISLEGKPLLCFSKSTPPTSLMGKGDLLNIMEAFDTTWIQSPSPDYIPSPPLPPPRLCNHLLPSNSLLFKWLNTTTKSSSNLFMLPCNPTGRVMLSCGPDYLFGVLQINQG